MLSCYSSSFLLTLKKENEENKEKGKPNHWYEPKAGTMSQPEVRERVRKENVIIQIEI